MSISRHAGNLREPSVVSWETMHRTILECGMVPFFENPIPGYSIEEMTPREYWFDGEAGILGPWDWKIDCLQTGDILYGKYLCGGKAAFSTVKLYKELRNYRQSLPKYALDPSSPLSQIMDYIHENGAITVKEVRGLLGIKKSAADSLLTKLQMQCRVVIGDLTRVYSGADLHYSGWQHASFCTPEDLMDEDLSVSHTPSESYQILSEHILSLFEETSEKQIARILG